MNEPNEMSILLYRGIGVMYGINTKHQFIALDNDGKRIPNIVTNITSDYSFCMDGDTLYLCTQCDQKYQILRFTLNTVPTPVFTDEPIPKLTHMTVFKGYIGAITDTDIYVYDIARNQKVNQPSWTGGLYQGVVGYKDSLYFKKNGNLLEIPFLAGILDYGNATLNENTTNLVSLYYKLDPSEPAGNVKYSNVKISIVEPETEEVLSIGFDKVRIRGNEFANSVTLADNLPTYILDRNFTYLMTNASPDKVICPYQDNVIYGTICFLSGSMVLTDQGPVAIEFIIPYMHTIFKKEIIGLSITYSLEDILVCIEKNALAKYVPMKDTYLSSNHRIFYKNKFLEAGDLVGHKGVYTLPYNNQLLYNVILNQHDIMNVNNIICETLDPKNPAAKEFIGLYND